MKGITHFAVGIALATCFPDAVLQAQVGGLLPLLGGVAGLLPDTLDFKVLRYFVQHDVEIDPGFPADADAIAAQLTAAMQEAYHSYRRRRVLLRTVRIGADAWQRVTLCFDQDSGQIAVSVGPAVTTGQAPLPGSAPQGAQAQLPAGVPLVVEFDGEVQADIFSGPSLTFEREGDGLHVRLLDWHRAWTHSLAFAALLGLLIASAWALAEGLARGAVSTLPLWAGLIGAVALGAHAAVDQLGHMGCCLLFPFSRRRIRGLRWFHSGDAVPNFALVWVSAWLILFNLDRFSSRQLLPTAAMVGLGLALPLAVLGSAAWLGRRRKRHATPTGGAANDLAAESEEVELA